MIDKPARFGFFSPCTPIQLDRVHLNKTSWYLSFEKRSRDLLATWKEAISQKNCDKILKERRVFVSGSPTILGTKPWVLKEIGREIQSPLSQRKTKAINRIYKPHIYICTRIFTNDFTLGALNGFSPFSLSIPLTLTLSTTFYAVDLYAAMLFALPRPFLFFLVD